MTTELTHRMQGAQYRLAEHYLEKLQTAQRAYQQGNEFAAQALILFDQRARTGASMASLGLATRSRR